MTKRELAESLRSRLAEKFDRGELDKTLPKDRDSFLRNLTSTSDDAMIGGYLICSACGKASISIQHAVRLAANCGTVDDWIRRVVAWEHLFGECRHEAHY